MALMTVSARKAFTLLFRGVADVLSVENDSHNIRDLESWVEFSKSEFDSVPNNHKWVKCNRFYLMVPRIIRLNCFGHLPAQKIRFTRKNLYVRDNYECQYCGLTLPASKLNIDHVLPRSQGGSSTWENTVASCIPCNSHKDNRTPEQAKMKLKKTPKAPKYLSAFRQQCSDLNPDWKVFIY